MVARKLKSPAVGATASFAASQKVAEIVKTVIDDIRANGDQAVRAYSEKFDKWSRPQGFKLSDDEINEAISKVPAQTIEDIKTVQHNVRVFAQAQRECIKDLEIETQPGVFLGHRNNPIHTAGA